MSKFKLARRTLLIVLILQSLCLFHTDVYGAIEGNQVIEWVKPIAVIDGCDTRFAANMFDDDENTIWQHFSEERHWVVLDMGQSVEIGMIRQWHRSTFDTEYAIEEIYVSDSLDDWGDSIGSIRRIHREDPGWKEATLTPKIGRYVKLVTELSRSPYFREIRFGVLRDTETPEPAPEANTSAWVKAVSVIDGCDTRYAGNMFDDDENTIWQHFSDERHWVVLDMGQSVQIGKIRQWHRSTFDTEYAIEEIYVSDNFDDWGASVGGIGRIHREDPGWKEALLTPKTGRYVKLVTELSRSPYFREIEFGLITETNPPEDPEGTAVVTASSLSVVDIQAAINSLETLGGGTVILPSGQVDHQNTVINMPAGIHLFGQGKDLTQIQNSEIRVTGDNDRTISTRISNLFLGGFSHIQMVRVENFRIDHIHIETLHTNNDYQGAIRLVDSHSGVIDTSAIHSNMYGINIINQSDRYETDWVSDTSILLGSPNAVFIEDNEFEHYRHGTVGHANAHYVVRHNYFQGGNDGLPPSHAIDGHGVGFTDSNTGTRLIEAYNNTISAEYNNEPYDWKAIAIRAGSAVIFDNYLIGWDNGIALTLDMYDSDADHNNTELFPHDIWVWDNSVDNPEQLDEMVFVTSQMNDSPDGGHTGGTIPRYSEDYIRLGQEYHLRAPDLLQDGFAYTPYMYPHPYRTEYSTPDSVVLVSPVGPIVSTPPSDPSDPPPEPDPGSAITESESLSIDDIEAAIATIRNLGGGTVILPEGEVDHGGARLALTAGIQIIGQGVEKTRILNANIYLDSRNGNDLGHLTRLSGVYLGETSTIEFREVENFRIDHIHLERTGGQGVILRDSTRGVIDNSYFDTTNYGIMVTTMGNLADDWNADTQAVLQQTTAGDSIFIENCEFINYHHALVGHNNGRYVARYNTFHGGNRGNQPSHPIDAHGDFYAGDMGTRLIEVYNNLISASDNTLGQAWKAIAVRGGAAIIFNNTYQDWRNGVVLTLDSHNDENDTPENRQTWPKDIWIWDNTYQMDVLNENHWESYVFRTNDMNGHGYLNSFEEIIENEQFFLRAPNLSDDGFEYNPYTYPHPIRSLESETDGNNDSGSSGSGEASGGNESGQETIRPGAYYGPKSTDGIKIIADHRIVDDFAKIPDEYLDIVKTYWVQALGESHSAIFRYGVESLALEEPRYKATRQEYGDAPYPVNPDQYGLRVNRIYWDKYRSNDDPDVTGNWDQLRGTTTLEALQSKRPFGISEEEFWTTQWAVDYMKENIRGSNDPLRGNNPVKAILFVTGWHIATGTGGTTDPVHGTRWGGRSFYFDSETRNFVTAYSETRNWGLTDEHLAYVDPNGTRQHPVALTDMIKAVEQLNGVDLNTVVMLTTDAVDVNGSVNTGESGYQRFLKHEYMRQYVQDNGGVLFDMADILSYNNAGEHALLTWTNRHGNEVEFPTIHPDNDGEYRGTDGIESLSCHIGREGSIRVAKALWWTLARLAGWDGM